MGFRLPTNIAIASVDLYKLLRIVVMQCVCLMSCVYCQFSLTYWDAVLGLDSSKRKKADTGNAECMLNLTVCAVNAVELRAWLSLHAFCRALAGVVFVRN